MRGSLFFQTIHNIQFMIQLMKGKALRKHSLYDKTAEDQKCRTTQETHLTLNVYFTLTRLKNLTQI